MTKRPDIATSKLEAMVRERIEQGWLPAAFSVTVRAGYGGSGAKCAVCALEIEPKHVEYELTGVNGRPLLLHLRCHHAWQTQCIELQPKKR